MANPSPVLGAEARFLAAPLLAVEPSAWKAGLAEGADPKDNVVGAGSLSWSIGTMPTDLLPERARGQQSTSREQTDVSAELASLILDEVDDILFASEIGALETAPPTTMKEAGYPDIPALTADIAMLARQHAAVTDNSRTRIRFEVVETRLRIHPALRGTCESTPFPTVR